MTTLEQTVLDCLTWLPPLDGLVVADSALAAGLDRAAALAELADRRQRNGRARAATLLGLADRGAESEWETWLRYVALRAGLPAATTQLPVETHLGPMRVDLAWPAYGVLAEFDGAVKYTDGAFGAGYDGRRALVAEKRREDAIAEALGVRPVRFMATDARRPDLVVARLTARFPADVRAALRPDRRLPALPPWSPPGRA
ncbi:MAG: hypothetical protein FWF90_04600 [Promicromonosporaceae bacterium]|nr:hypothetical protein [Promicromonosporaceae bacterium]